MSQSIEKSVPKLVAVHQSSKSYYKNKVKEAHIFCHLAGPDHKMNTLSEAFKLFFCSNSADTLFNDG